ncbi:MAG: hypothetical protein P0Y66_19095 [Candidatus Kaistia colombiensis]|nr:MAG: hypothetical protein P0Y66_19095 [Kaistia sp.]
MSEARPENAPQRPQAERPAALPLGDGRRNAGSTLTGIEATMDGLLQLIEAEALLLREGKAFAAAELGQRKSHYAKRYIDELALLGAIGQSLEDLDPGQLDKLRQRHEEFRSILQINLAALATAHAVSDGGFRVIADNPQPPRRREPAKGDGHPEPRFNRRGG